MRRLWATSVTLALTLLAVGAGSTGAAPTARHVDDAKFKISFFLPRDWGPAQVTLTTTGSTKVLIVNPTSSGAAGVAQVIVELGRQIGASKLAAVLRQGGATVTGSHLANVGVIHNAEQMSYSVESNGTLVYGTAEAFYEHRLTYYVAVDSASTTVVTKTLKAILATWGT